MQPCRRLLSKSPQVRKYHFSIHFAPKGPLFKSVFFEKRADAHSGKPFLCFYAWWRSIILDSYEVLASYCKYISEQIDPMIRTYATQHRNPSRIGVVWEGTSKQKTAQPSEEERLYITLWALPVKIDYYNDKYPTIWLETCTRVTYSNYSSNHMHPIQ